MKKTLFLILPLVAVLILSGCSLTEKKSAKSEEEKPTNSKLLQVDAEGNTNVDSAALHEVLVAQEGVELSDEEIAGVKFMYEEEKLAKDVYRALFAKWDLQSFDNISQSEATHQAAVRSIADAYGVKMDDVSDVDGQFNSEELQELHDELITKGNISLIEALKVGAAIEEIDILDLEKYINATTNEDIILVYKNLQRGSRNHLRAFVRNMEKNGEQYQAQYMETERYQEVVSGDVERGESNQDGQKSKGRGGNRK